MPPRRHLSNTALLVAFAAMALTGYGLVIAPAQDDEARRAVRAMGYRVDEIRRAPLAAFCARHRAGYAWRSGPVTGQACVGNFLPPAVEVW